MGEWKSAWDPRRLFDDQPPPRTLVVAGTLAFAAITLFVALHHEAWRDEADSWLFVRDADLATILARTRYTGFPALWYLILAPLPRLGLPYISQSLLHLAIATAAVGVLLASLPLARLTRLLAAFSYYFAYEYSVIARTYALTILLAFVAVAMHRRRDAHPLAYAVVLALLFNVSAHGFFIAGTLAALFVLERWPRGRRLAAAAIMTVAAIAAWLQVRRPPDAMRVGGIHPLDVHAFTWSVGNAFLPTLPAGIGFAAGMVMIGVLMLALRRAQASLFLFWLPFTALSILYAYIWMGGLRHAGLFLVVAILAISVAREDEIDRRYAAAAALLLNACLLVSCGVAVRVWVLDTREAFSGAKEMAEFIAGHHLDSIDIAAHNAPQCEAILPYLPGRKQFWYAGIEDYGSYLRWDAPYERGLDVPYRWAELRAQRHFAGRGRPWLLLFNVEIPEPAAHGFRLLYATRRPVFDKRDERFWLYAPLR